MMPRVYQALVLYVHLVHCSQLWDPRELVNWPGKQRRENTPWKPCVHPRQQSHNLAVLVLDEKASTRDLIVLSQSEAGHTLRLLSVSVESRGAGGGGRAFVELWFQNNDGGNASQTNSSQSQKLPCAQQT